MIICLWTSLVSIYLYDTTLINSLINTTFPRTHFQKRMDLLENNIDKRINRIENGLNVDLVEIHHLLHNGN